MRIRDILQIDGMAEMAGKKPTAGASTPTEKRGAAAPKTSSKKPGNTSSSSSSSKKPGVTAGSSTLSRVPNTVAATSGSSAKKQNTVKNKKEDGTILEPGRSANSKSYLKRNWQREGQCAAYLGFHHIQDLRKFALTSMVIRAYLKGQEDFIAIKQERILEVLRDCPIETASEEDPLIKYPAHDKDKDMSMLRGALIVAQLRRAIEKAYSTQLVLTKKEIEECCSEFDQRSGPSKSNIPRINHTSTQIKLPNLGPFHDLKENDLEAYNRTYSIIRYLGFSLQAPWRTRFGSSSWDKEVALVESHVPHWMRPRTTPFIAAAPNAPKVPAALDTPERSARVVRVIWLYKNKTPVPTSFRESLEQKWGNDELIELLSLKQDIMIKYETPVELFRNNIRYTFKLELLTAHIEVLKFTHVLRDGDKESIDVNLGTWNNEIKEILWRDNLDTKESAFYFTTSMADSEDFIMEQVKDHSSSRQLSIFKEGEEMVGLRPADNADGINSIGDTYEKGSSKKRKRNVD
jgi:hypothetical protein